MPFIFLSFFFHFFFFFFFGLIFISSSFRSLTDFLLVFLGPRQPSHVRSPPRPKKTRSKHSYISSSFFFLFFFFISFFFFSSFRPATQAPTPATPPTSAAPVPAGPPAPSTPQSQESMMFTLRAPTKKKRKRKSVSPSPSPSPTPPPARPQARNLRKKVYVSDVFHQKVSQLAHERQESFSQVVSYLLNTNNPDAAPLPAATPTAPARDARLSSPRVALVEVDQFKTLFQYIHCKEHHLPCRCQLTFRGLSPYVKATCSEGCAFTF